MVNCHQKLHSDVVSLAYLFVQHDLKAYEIVGVILLSPHKG
jgi:hypothetical protein